MKFYLKNYISDKSVPALKDPDSLHSESLERAGQTFPERIVGGSGILLTTSSERVRELLCWNACPRLQG